MGKKARERRKREKALFGKVVRLERWRENEFGELTRRMTKAEARRQLVAKAAVFARVEREIVSRMADVARRDIEAEEDRHFAAGLNYAAACAASFRDPLGS